MRDDYDLIVSRSAHTKLFGGDAINPLWIFEGCELKPQLIAFLQEFPQVLLRGLHAIGQSYDLDSGPHIDRDTGQA
jgi:hypothetical protein